MYNAWSNRLCIDFFILRPSPLSCKVNLQDDRIIYQYCVSVLLPMSTLWSFTKHLHPDFSEPYRNPWEPHLHPNISTGLCTGTLQNFRYLHWNPPEPHQVSAPEQNLTRYLHGNPPEPQQVSAPEPFRTSTVICTGTLQNLTRYLHQNPPEPPQVSAPEPSRTSPGTWC